MQLLDRSCSVTRHNAFQYTSLLKTWRGNFLVLARKAKNSHATTKKISFHFFRKFKPKSVCFWFGSMNLKCTVVRKNIIHRKIRELAERQAMANRIIEVNHRLNNYKAQAKDRLNSE
ncbi:Protein of unknown function (DUF1661) [Porphyromonas gingivalis 381]|nr:Protein of unknown function (DUF1661) [Porphyromonas gingivalis 381]HBW77600.1 DUF1661 domain-containing protein [Porphyromonas gingivalis]